MLDYVSIHHAKTSFSIANLIFFSVIFTLTELIDPLF